MNAHGYPVELACPDIYTHAPSDAGIAYVHTSGSNVAGVRMGRVAARMLQPRRGRLTLAFANADAYVQSMHERSEPLNRCEI